MNRIDAIHITTDQTILRAQITRNRLGRQLAAALLRADYTDGQD